MDELNRKLAEWRGFKWGFFEPRIANVQKYKYEHGFWMTPDGQVYGQSLPDFTHSLDACFKWLVPKLMEIRETPAIAIQFELDEESNVDCEIEGGFPNWQRGWMMGSGETPALAFCKAIEKLMEAKDG